MPAFDIAELTFQEELSNSVFLIANYFSHSRLNISEAGVYKNHPNPNPRFGIERIVLVL